LHKLSIGAVLNSTELPLYPPSFLRGADVT
jgi:hypothetical protein